MIGVVVVLALYGLVVTAAVSRLYRDLQAAQDRLLAAWKDGYQVPEPAPPVAEPEPESPEFPPALEEWLLQWDAGETRDRWRRRARGLMIQYSDNLKKVFADLESPAYRQ